MYQRSSVQLSHPRDACFSFGSIECIVKASRKNSDWTWLKPVVTRSSSWTAWAVCHWSLLPLVSWAVCTTTQRTPTVWCDTPLRQPSRQSKPLLEQQCQSSARLCQVGHRTAPFFRAFCCKSNRSFLSCSLDSLIFSRLYGSRVYWLFLSGKVFPHSTASNEASRLSNFYLL